MPDNPILRLIAAIIVIWAVIWSLGLTSAGGGYDFTATGEQIKEALTPSNNPMPGSNDAAVSEAMPGGR